MLGPVCAQVIRQAKLPASGRKFPALTGRSGTQRARRLLLRPAFGTSAPWSSPSPSELRDRGSWRLSGAVHLRCCSVRTSTAPEAAITVWRTAPAP